MTPQDPITEAGRADSRAAHLAAVERWVLWLCAGLLIVSIPFGGPRGQLGALCGAGMSLLNARLLSRLGTWAERGAEGGARLRLGLVLGAFQLKLGLIAVLLYVTLKFLPVAPLWLLVGLTLLPLAICIRAVEYAKTGAKGDPVPHG